MGVPTQGSAKISAIFVAPEVLAVSLLHELLVEPHALRPQLLHAYQHLLLSLRYPKITIDFSSTKIYT